jgi:molecular chaperone DnaJ
MRLQIRQGMSQDVNTVEVALPPGFVTGNSIRIEGLGRKIGRWQGDLYLRVNAKN